MGIECGSQCTICDLPIRFDTYKGCSHACSYCFVKKKTDISKIAFAGTVNELKGFIAGKRNAMTSWCDWDIPLHWGGVSDPFQPVEKRHGVSLECLKVFAQTQYPFVVSTKGKLIVEGEYFETIKRCNCVVQISMACSEYDKIERGAPKFEKRLEMVRKLSPHVRVICRIQPYMVEVHDSIFKNLSAMAEAGAYGVIVEGYKSQKKAPGMVRIGGDFCYPLEILRAKYTLLKAEAHAHGMKFYCGENRLRALGDSLTCCGIDGMEGFKPNTFNLNRIFHGEKPEATEAMNKEGSASCFKSLHQEAGVHDYLKTRSFRDLMLQHATAKTDYYKKIFGQKK